MDDLPNQSDAQHVQSLVSRQLMGRAQVRDLQVLVHQSGVVLRGRASSYYAKQLAQHAAMAVSGLPILANDIEVQ
jgi:osmotically-inducible protein OsmY